MRGLKNIRLRDYDYRSNGYYFVTVVADYRRKYFLGKSQLIEEVLKDLAKSIPGLELDYYVVMPNHVHVIFILRQCNLVLGKIVRRFKAKVSFRMGIKIWQPNYYEHVIRNDRVLNKIREYIIHNPDVEKIDFESFYENASQKKADKSANYKNL
ncbi:MAG: transposase [bacterium]|nr:transposase [bacterium]